MYPRWRRLRGAWDESRSSSSHDPSHEPRRRATQSRNVAGQRVVPPAGFEPAPPPPESCPLHDPGLLPATLVHGKGLRVLGLPYSTPVRTTSRTTPAGVHPLAGHTPSMIVSRRLG